MLAAFSIAAALALLFIAAVESVDEVIRTLRRVLIFSSLDEPGVPDPVVVADAFWLPLTTGDVVACVVPMVVPVAVLLSGPAVTVLLEVGDEETVPADDVCTEVPECA
uniref:Putative secreted protein n=1 Tax=Anopheles triannulatus TaxID=58253 RepID=A0A2M4B4F2_9DIPT